MVQIIMRNSTSRYCTSPEASSGVQVHFHDMQDRKNALAGIDILRKICNHPDLLQRKQWESVKQYGDPVRSGKLTVAMKVIVPLFCVGCPGLAWRCLPTHGRAHPLQHCCCFDNMMEALFLWLIKKESMHAGACTLEGAGTQGAGLHADAADAGHHGQSSSGPGLQVSAGLCPPERLSAHTLLQARYKQN